MVDCGVSCNSNIPLLKTSSSFDGHFTETILAKGEIIFNTKRESQQHRLASSLCMLSKSTWTFPLHKKIKKIKIKKNQSTDTTGRWKNLGDVELIYPFPIITGGLYVTL